MTDQNADAPKSNGSTVLPATAEQAAETPKVPKAKLVRDSFTIPKAEYTTLNELRQRATRLAQPAKKSELLRAGIELLRSLSDQAFLAALAAVPNLKTGRPKKDGDESDQPAVKTGKKIIDKIAARPAAKNAAKTGAKAAAKGETGTAKGPKKAGANAAKNPARNAAKKAAKQAAGNDAKAARQAARAARRAEEEA
ncbi:MAG TPA: hypothetical protein VFY73_05310 [Ideonella sp.]|uniref:hypothetical protein n=1 Tax=Ideonella sp. TaxID=1929293 RepID=UPI002E37219C|nr:hypothetical protein [Ideonella sp.]HEX5683436.1 hypothetical protein [Ideonella sp.]